MSQVKKSRRGKKGRKNDAEKKLLQEQEMIRKREVLLETFMKDKISRESQSVTLNAIKLNWQWRSVMREKRHGELQAETEVLRNRFDHVVQMKDRVIDVLGYDINQWEDEHDRIIESQLENLNKLLDLQDDHLKCIQTSYDLQKAHMTKSMDEELNASSENHKKEVGIIRNTEQTLKTELQQLETSIVAQFQNRRDQLLNKSIEEQHAIRSELNTTIERLWHQLQSIYRSHQLNTTDKKKIFDQLKLKDESNRKEISQQAKKLQNLTIATTNLRQQQQLLLKETLVRDQVLERKQLSTKFRHNIATANETRQTNREQITTLTVTSNAVIQQLEDHLQMGKQILRLSTMCSRCDHPNLGTANSRLEKKTPVNHDGRSVQQKMDKFWHNYSQLYHETTLMKTEIKLLKRENKYLSNVFQEYLSDIAANGNYRYVPLRGN